jgi:hypothetical protein
MLTTPSHHSPQLVTAAQIKRRCPVEVDTLGRQIAARLQKVRDYEAKAQEKAGVELRKADDNWTTVTQLLAEAKAKCDADGFKAFKEKYCPDLGGSRIYELLQIGSGKKTVEQVKAEGRGRKARQRAKNKRESVTDTVTDKAAPADETLLLEALLPATAKIAEVDLEQRRAEHAVLDDLSPEEKAKAEYAEWLEACDKAQKASAQALAEFAIACRTWLPKVTKQSDRDKARRLVVKMTEPLKVEEAVNATLAAGAPAVALPPTMGELDAHIAPCRAFDGSISDDLSIPTFLHRENEQPPAVVTTVEPIAPTPEPVAPPPSSPTPKPSPTLRRDPLKVDWRRLDADDLGNAIADAQRYGVDHDDETHEHKEKRLRLLERMRKLAREKAHAAISRS